MVPSALLALIAFQKDRTQTLGRSYAEILRMGEDRWTAVYAQRKGDSPLATSYAFSIYGDALGWRNDRLLKGRAFPLRKRLEAFSSDVQGAGYALSGGGSMWYIIDGQYHRDVELTLYRVLSHARIAPGRVVSDVEKALDALGKAAARIEDPGGRRDALESTAKARKSLRAVVQSAKGLPRRDSDTVLEFCRTAALGIVDAMKDR